MENTREISWPRLLVSVPISSTVGASTSPRIDEHLVAAQRRQRAVARPVEHRVQRTEVVRLGPRGVVDALAFSRRAQLGVADRGGGGELQLLQHPACCR